MSDFQTVAPQPAPQEDSPRGTRGTILLVSVGLLIVGLLAAILVVLLTGDGESETDRALSLIHI